MADSDWSSSGSSGSDATSRAMDEDDVRALVVREREQAGNVGHYSVVEQHYDLLVSLGSLRFPDILESLLLYERWPEIARYLRHALRFHAKDAAEAVAYPPARATDMRRAHPELYLLPRRQHALHLFSAGQHDQALHFYHERILPRILAVRRNAHVNALVESLGAILAGQQPLAIRDYDREVASTSRAIRDYVQVYFPGFCNSFYQKMMIGHSMDKLGQAWSFGEVLMPGDILDPTTTIRCLVCHAQLPMGTFPDAKLLDHLYMGCPATTPHIHRLLPRPLNPRQVARRAQLLQQDEAAADAAAAAEEEEEEEEEEDDGDNAGPPAGDGGDE
ncbi:hypothetical protein EJB05_31950 [Eragrostis curvula]|uniref:Uncharacterized protein n=1 Tax=Eragrostis curvula TaxID=38414 RepID=A0A5J9UFF0_9POAL|nr:hypothetical protein EJB05_31950 [Eragrostis curvula]